MVSFNNFKFVKLRSPLNGIRSRKRHVVLFITSVLGIYKIKKYTIHNEYLFR